MLFNLFSFCSILERNLLIFPVLKIYFFLFLGFNTSFLFAGVAHIKNQKIVLSHKLRGGANVLTQDMFKQANAIYEIQSDFDLQGRKIILPINSILKFNGGCLSNGELEGNSSDIHSDCIRIFRDIVIAGKWQVKDIYTCWFNFNEHKDDYRNFQNLIALTDHSIHNNIHFEDKDFYASKSNHLLNIKSNTTLNLNRAKIHVLPNNDRNFCVIDIRGVHDVAILNGTIIGDIREHTTISGSSDEWNHGIRISGSKNVLIKNTKSTYNMGDGVDIIDMTNPDKTVSISQNITLENVICDNNGRQGFSIEGADNVLMKGCKGINTGQVKYVKPSLGLDIEPWRKEGLCTNITITDCEFTNSKADYYDVIIQPNHLLKKKNKINNNILMKKCMLSKNAYIRCVNGFRIDSIISHRKMNIDVENCDNVKLSNAIFANRIYCQDIVELTLCNIKSNILDINNSDNVVCEKTALSALIIKDVDYIKIIDSKLLKTDSICKPSCIKNSKYIEFKGCQLNRSIDSWQMPFTYYKLNDCIINVNELSDKDLRICNVSNIENCIFNTPHEVVVNNPDSSICMVYNNKWVKGRHPIKDVAFRIHNNNSAILYFIDNLIYDAKKALTVDFGTENVNYYSTQKIQPYLYLFKNLKILNGSIGLINNKLMIYNGVQWNHYIERLAPLSGLSRYEIKPQKPQDGNIFKDSSGTWFIRSQNKWKLLQNNSLK